MNYLYGVFLPTDYPGYNNLPQDRKWALRNTAQEAKALAKEFGGSIRRMPYPEARVWDMTTFRTSSSPYPLPEVGQPYSTYINKPGDFKFQAAPSAKVRDIVSALDMAQNKYGYRSW